MTQKQKRGMSKLHLAVLIVLSILIVSVPLVAAETQSSWNIIDWVAGLFSGGGSLTGAVVGAACVDNNGCDAGEICDLVGTCQLCQSQPANTLSRWDGDLVSGSQVFDLVGTNNAVLQSGASTVPGLVGDAFHFPGTGNVFISSSPSLDITNQITVEGWIKPVFAGRPRSGIDSDTLYSVDVGFNHGQHQLSVLMDPGFFGVSLGTPSAALVIGGVSASVVASGSTVTNDGQFHHLAMTYDGSNLKIYLDGTEIASTPASGTMDGGNSGAYIGRRVNTPKDSLADIDEVNVYDRALSASEIGAIANAGNAGVCKPAPPVCGDSIIEGSEACDDGGVVPGDGCSATCQIESGYQCTGEPSVCTLLSCVSPPTSMVAWWAGDGDATDLIGVNDGSAQNGATFAAGKVGSAFSLDGSDDFVDAGSDASLDISGDLTIDFWAQATSVSGFGAVVDMAQEGTSIENYAVLNINGDFYFQWFNGAFQSVVVPGFFSSGVWVHGAVTFNAGTVTVYKDGVQVAQQSGKPALVASPANVLKIGRYQVGSQGNFHGLIDELEIFDRALSSLEVQSIYNADSNGKCKVGACVAAPANLQHWWTLDGDATDLQGSNDGTAQGGVSFVAGQVDQAASFDGVNDFIRAGDSSNLGWGAQKTFSAWVRSSGASGFDTVMGKANDWVLQTSTPGDDSTYQLYCYGTASFVGPTIDLSDNQFHHVSLVIDNSQYCAHRDGVNLGCVGITSCAPGGNFDLGAVIGLHHFNGVIDEFHYFDRALLSTEVQDLANPAGVCKPGTVVCGDGLIEASEACDDGNVAPGDGCSDLCVVESGFSCIGEPSVCTPALSVGGGPSQCIGSDSAETDPFTCGDTDSDTCEDCISGHFDPSNDGSDFDGDGLCDAGDNDDDNDGVLDGVDICPTTPFGLAVDATGCACSDAGHVSCDDSVSCTIDTCNPTTAQCDHSPDNAFCIAQDGQFCNGEEVCDVNLDCQPGTPPTGDDGISCTSDICDEDTDSFIHSPTNALCSNGEFCDGEEICDVSQGCIDGPDPQIDDGIDCTVDVCDNIAGEIRHNPSDGLCSDQKACTGIDVCDPVNGCQVQAGTDLNVICLSSFGQCVNELTNPREYFTGFCDESGPQCQVAIKPPESGVLCSNGIDDDCDSFVDNFDSDCSTCDSLSFLSCNPGELLMSDEQTQSNMCGDGQSYSVDVPPGETCDITWFMDPHSEDFDLHAKSSPGICATDTDFDCRPFSGTGVTEECFIQGATQGRYFAFVTHYPPATAPAGDYEISVALVCSQDADADGFTTTGGDCDDRPDGADGIPGTADDGANINPGATEICGDQIDQDCNGPNPECAVSPTTTLTVLKDSFGTGGEKFGYATIRELGGLSLGYFATGPFIDTTEASNTGNLYLEPIYSWDEPRKLLASAVEAGTKLGTEGVSYITGNGDTAFILGAHYADPDAKSNAGQLYLSVGRSDFERVIDGGSAGDNYGKNVIVLDDTNSDGFPEVVVSASGADPNGETNAGEAHLIDGASLFDQSPLVSIIVAGEDPYDEFSASMATIPDVDQDGSSDWVAGARKANANGMPDSGKSYILNGRTGAVIEVIDGAEVGALSGTAVTGLDGTHVVVGEPGAHGGLGAVKGYDVTSLPASLSFEIIGEGNGFGTQIAAANMVGDSKEELMVSAPDSDTMYIYDPNTGVLLFQDTYSTLGVDYGGEEITNIGDVTFDSHDDVVVTGKNADSNNGVARVLTVVEGIALDQSTVDITSGIVTLEANTNYHLTEDISAVRIVMEDGSVLEGSGNTITFTGLTGIEAGLDTVLRNIEVIGPSSSGSTMIEAQPDASVDLKNVHIVMPEEGTGIKVTEGADVTVNRAVLRLEAPDSVGLDITEASVADVNAFVAKMTSTSTGSVAIENRGTLTATTTIIEFDPIPGPVTGISNAGSAVFQDLEYIASLEDGQLPIIPITFYDGDTTSDATISGLGSSRR